MTTNQTHKMEVRNVKFDFSDITDQHYVGNNMFGTHFVNALHVLFPVGEKFFVRSVKNYFDEITDPALKKEMIEFMGQEGIHHREHERFWEQMEKMDLKPMPFVNACENSINFLTKSFYFFLPKSWANKIALSATTGMEHYTALFGNQSLGNQEFSRTLMPPEMHMLMMWHSAEELEHKAVAFDVFQQVSGSYFIRILGFLIASTFFYVFAFGGMFYFIKQDKHRNTKGLFKQLKDFLVNMGSRPKDMAGLKILLDYFKPSFHPDQHDNYHLATEFFEQNETYFANRK